MFLVYENGEAFWQDNEMLLQKIGWKRFFLRVMPKD